MIKRKFQTFLNIIDSLLTRHRVIAYSRTMLFSFIAFIIIFTITGHIDKKDIVQGDFMAFYTAGIIASDYYSQSNNNLYDLELQMEIQQKSGIIEAGEAPTIFLNPPLYAWLMVPFSQFPYLTAFNIWRSLSLLLAIISVIILTKNLKLNVPWWDSLVLFLVSMPGFAVIIDGQNSFLFLSLYAISYLLLLRKYDFAAGLVLGFGALKPQLFFLFPFILLLHKKWLVLIGNVVGCLVIIVASVLLIGTEGFYSYLRIFNSDLYIHGIQTQIVKMYSFPAFIRLLFGSGINANIIAVCTLLALLTVIGWYVFFKGYKFNVPVLYSIAILGALITAPHLFYYDLSLLLLPFLVLYSWTISCNLKAITARNYRIALLFMYVLLWVIFLLVEIIRFQVVTLLLIYFFFIMIKPKSHVSLKQSL